ncbi:hypothetical protein H4J59_01685 [Colwellia sp. MB02u-10]|uniref:hypothetical protein n=1 Tax=Colwellia sp. MB02u-10 TaxID=2759828 RepID=UPI0015F58096|nr:hypothetical protein [Colwellia sp. MB02u-10]MBA6339726.1 hypothetical protein [Colwellia sp. MB02u-10]
MESKNKSIYISLIVLFLITSCASQPISIDSNSPGFFIGLFHGFSIVFSLIGSLFTDIRIYASPNSGGWYDYGYFIGVAAFFNVVKKFEQSYS